jgi:phage FluMu gp28-like protein
MNFTPHPIQLEVLQDPHRFKVLACGRRWGKTELGKAIAIEAAKRGETVWWISPNYPQSVDVWISLKTTLAEIYESKSEQYRLLTLPGGGSIRVRSGSAPDSLRGAALDLVILDEAAFMNEYVWISAIRPALSDRKGRAVFLSTPNGATNWFHRVYRNGLDPLHEEWRSWHFPTETNPYISPDEIEIAKSELPERVFRAEYGAEFIEDSGAVFRNVKEAATAPRDPPYNPDHRYVMGVDWGRINDFTVAVVIDMDEQAVVEIDRFNQVGWSIQRGRLMALAERWKPSTIYAEANSIGAPNIEALVSEGLYVQSFNTTRTSKTRIIEELVQAIETHRIALPNHPILINELLAFEYTPSNQGLRYKPPPGGHDDTVIALAIAWHAGQHSGTGLGFA